VTAANSLHQRIGGMSFPLASGTDPDLTDLDPAQDILLELFAAAITAELLPRWTDAVASTPLAGRDPVATKLPKFPDPEAMRQVKFSFPLLCVERAGSPVQVEDFSFDQIKETWRWDVDYLLGPLSIGDSAALDNALLAAGRVMTMTVRDGGHRAYATQGAYPKSVFAAGEGCCYFSSVRVVEYQTGAAQLSADSPKFHAASMTLETVELMHRLDSGFPAAKSYQGSSVQLQTGTEQGLKTLVTADTATPIPTP
jgi:hypothetical protein